jgi:hypothetical protein
MARLARVVVPSYPQHVTQRGNRRQPVFFCDHDYADYIELMITAKTEAQVEVWAYCLMQNHVQNRCWSVSTIGQTIMEKRVIVNNSWKYENTVTPGDHWGVKSLLARLKTRQAVACARNGRDPNSIECVIKYCVPGMTVVKICESCSLTACCVATGEGDACRRNAAAGCSRLSGLRPDQPGSRPGGG